MVQSNTGLDPTGGWKMPLDLWLADKGDPARTPPAAASTSTPSTPRSPEEWLRELAHEYGHTAFPGLGGFTKTDDTRGPMGNWENCFSSSGSPPPTRTGSLGQ